MNGAKHIATRAAWRMSLACVLSLLPALGAQAALLVSNTRGNNVVMIDDKTGAYLGDFITAGSGGLTDPDDVTIGPDGKVYVSSGGNTTGSILRYSSSGAFIDTFATGNGLKRPYGNAFGPDGNLYVASFRSDQILRYSGSTGAFIDVFAQGNGSAAGLLNGPNDLVFAPNGMLYVTTQGSVADGMGGISYQFDSQLLAYSVSTGAGSVIATPSPTAGGNGYVSLLGAVVGPDGLLYTTDYAGGIRSYDTLTGALVQTIDTGPLFSGSSIATTLGNLVFAPDGTLYAPVFNEGVNGVEANGVAACAVATGSCALLLSDSTHLSRPIGIAYVPTPVPEPSVYALMLVGFAGVIGWRRRAAHTAGSGALNCAKLRPSGTPHDTLV